jgi:signal transduction histidine kinase
LDDRGGLRDLGRLKLIGVGAPVLFLIAFEAFRLLVLDAAFVPPTSNVVGTALLVVAAAVFGVVMFFHIERAQRQVVRQNRDLAVVNAVSGAIRGEIEIDAVVDAALSEIITATGASEATVTIQPLDPDGGPPREISRHSADATADALAAPGHPVDISLATGASPIGRLRLRIPAARVAQLPSAEALHTVGHQLAAALEIGRLVADLGRRRDEGHVLYQCLLQISNQVPLPDTLSGVVAGARDRLDADEGRICLTGSVVGAFEDDEEMSRRLSEGIACELPPAEVAAAASSNERHGPPAVAGNHRCGVGSDPSEAGLRVPIWIPGELLGELSLARYPRHPGSAPTPFTERDRRYLVTLAGITAIAISAARLRAFERQGAILAERDRIARELHDSLAQVLGSTHLRLRMLLARPEIAGQTRLTDELGSLAEVCEEAYADVREAILGLREASRGRGLVEALGAYLEKFSQQSGIPVSLDSHTEDEPALATSSEIQVIRVIQEALTNVRKHARATSANVRLTDAHDGAGLMIVVEDDGRGFDPAAPAFHRDGGYGLQTMRERMELAGGSLRIDSTPGAGTRIIAIVPQNPRVRPTVTSERA